MFYTPHTQQPSYHTMRMVVRTAADPAQITRQVRAELTQLDSDVPLSQVRTMSNAIEGTVAEPRMRATLLALFAGLALVLSAIGVYGVVAYLVGQRTREIGVRRALGAKTADVLAMLVREAMRPVGLGMALGVVGALAMTRALSAMLYGVSSTDVWTYSVACGVLGLAALCASVIPARRALTIEPMTAVRGG